MVKKTHYQQTNDCRKKNYDIIQINVPKGEKEKIKSRASELGLSVNAYIYNLIGIDLNND